MNIAVIGCGYVAEFYGQTIGNHPQLKLVGAFDLNADNLERFCRRWHVQSYGTMDDVLADSSVDTVLNLTNPRRHYEITKRCIEARKHVYSEKPLAMDAERAHELVRLAETQGVCLSSAPCSVLSEAAQTVWKALSRGAIGKVRLVYANFDDGMIAPKMSPWLWRNETGVPWPARDEFEVGCTYEHAGYILTWLAAFFGPALSVTSFSACLLQDKGIAVDSMAPDFSVGCIEYADGVVARITCSLVAPKDKSLTIIGDDGILTVADVRDDLCPVYVRSTPATRLLGGFERRINSLRRRIGIPGHQKEWHHWRRYPMAFKSSAHFVSATKVVDFCRGLAEMSDAIEHKRPCRLSARLGLHITELIEALQYPDRFGGRRELKFTFDPIQPLAW